MILVLYDNSDLSTIDFIEHLKCSGKLFMAIEAEELVKYIAIKDDGNTCEWIHTKSRIEIDFNKITGIYYRIFELDDRCVDNYQTEDQGYVQKEWWSYLVYRMQNSHNLINKITFEIMSSLIFQFPFYFDKAKDLGFKIPKYVVSSDFKEIEKHFKNGRNYITKTSTYHDTNFHISKELSNDTIALIERPKGQLVIVHVVGNEVFVCKWQNRIVESMEIDRHPQELCIELKNNLNLYLIQYMFVMSKNGEITLLHMTPYPNWNHNTENNKQQIYELLANKLEKTQN